MNKLEIEYHAALKALNYRRAYILFVAAFVCGQEIRLNGRPNAGQLQYDMTTYYFLNYLQAQDLLDAESDFKKFGSGRVELDANTLRIIPDVEKWEWKRIGINKISY